MKGVKIAGYIICIAIILWVVISWAEVLMHNNPYEEHNYSRFNCFQMMEENYDN